MLIPQRPSASLDAGLSALLERWANRVAAALGNQLPASIIFSLKTCGAALLALYLAFWLGLDQPKWALMTVFIVSQPDSGLVLAKSAYRILGTIAGTAATIALVFGLSQYGELFLASLAVWIGLCNFAARAARNFASYGFLLAGYTAAIIGIPAALNPDGAYPLILARFTEISLGILCAGLASRLILPRELMPTLMVRIDELIARVRRFAASVESPQVQQDLAAERIELLKDFVAVETMRFSAYFESPDARLLLGTVGRRLDAALHLIGVSEEALATFGSSKAFAPERLSPGLSTNLTSLAPLVALTEDTPGGNGSAISRLVRADIRRTLEEARRQLCRLDAGCHPDPAADTVRGTDSVWSDPGYAALTGLRSALSIVVTSAFWFITAWSSGPIAVIAAANACSLIGGMKQQTKITLAFIITLIVAAAPVFATEFYLLPVATDFLSLAVALAPLLLTCCFLMATQPLAVFPIVYFASSTSLTNTMSYDAVTYLNTTLAILVGFGITFMLFAVLLPESSPRLVRRFRGQLLIQLWHFSETRHLTLQAYERTLFDHLAVTFARAIDQQAASDCLSSAVTVAPIARAIDRLRDASDTIQHATEIAADIKELLKRLSETTVHQGRANLTKRAWEARRLRRRALAQVRLTPSLEESEALCAAVVGCEALRSGLLRARPLTQEDSDVR